MKTLRTNAALLGAILSVSVAWPQDPSALTAIKVFGREELGAKTVAGAPYIAEQTTRTTQTLADGNRIVNVSTAKVYRDQQGRTRVEETQGGIGAVATQDAARSTVMINDAVADTRYTLHPESRTAEKVESSGIPPVGKELAFFYKQDAEAQAKITMGGGGSLITSRALEFRPSVVTKEVHPDGTPAEEDLGTRAMEGLQVQGRRIVSTIAAGAIGNEQPIVIVDERWYSPELQLNIMTKHSDPRMGETVFTVTNVSRANPDLSLFQVPPDYQVTKSQRMVYRFNTSGK